MTSLLIALSMGCADDNTKDIEPTTDTVTTDTVTTDTDTTSTTETTEPLTLLYAEMCIGTDSSDYVIKNFDTGGGGLYNLYEVTGEVIADGSYTAPEHSLYLCHQAEVDTRGLTLQDDDGVTWTLGYAIYDTEKNSHTQPLSVSPGDRVTLRYEDYRTHGYLSHFVLRDSDSALVAVLREGNSDSFYISDGGVPELSATTGEVVRSDSDQCGDRAHSEMRFSGDTDITLSPGTFGVFTAGGAELTATNMLRYDYSNSDCSHAYGSTHWAVWR